MYLQFDLRPCTSKLQFKKKVKETYVIDLQEVEILIILYHHINFIN